MMNKDDYIVKQKEYKKFRNTKITLSKRALEMLAKQILLSSATPEKLKAIKRNESRVMKSLKREMYALSEKIDQEKLTNKQRTLITKRMNTLGRLLIHELIEVENALFGIPSTNSGVRR